MRNSSRNTSYLYQKILQDHPDPLPNSDLLFSLSSNHPSQPQPQVQMVIQYGIDQSASLMVSPLDDPHTLAQRFCFKHNIDPRIISVLSNNIKQLQMSSFGKGESGFKIQRNNTEFDDKENSNSRNRNRSKSAQKSKQRNNSKNTSMSRTNSKNTSMSRTNSKNTSMCNQSAITSNNTRPSGSRYNVFDRLYKHAKKSSRINPDSRINTTINKSLNQSSIKGCLQIYQKNTKKQIQARKHNQMLLQQKLKKQVQACKFKPQINSLSNLIASKLRQMDQSGIGYSDRHLIKARQYMLLKQQQQMRQCTFKPVLNTGKNSRSKTPSQPNTPSDRYRQLHQDHQLRQMKIKMQSKDKIKTQQHQPKINNISKIIVKNNFFQRLQADQIKRQKRKESQQKTLQRQRSAQKRPSTGRAPANRDLGQKTVGQYLYQKSRVTRCLQTKQQPKILTDPKSSQIHAASKSIAFHYIFQLLDSDQDGLISSAKIDINAIDEEILKLVAPLLSQMEQVQVQLNFQEFQLAFQRLFSTFSIREKDMILKSYKNKPKKSQRLSFQPTLNEKSLMIAREICGDDCDIYAASCQRLKDKQTKLNRMRAEKALMEYGECTFQPNVKRML